MIYVIEQDDILVIMTEDEYILFRKFINDEAWDIIERRFGIINNDFDERKFQNSILIEKPKGFVLT